MMSYENSIFHGECPYTGETCKDKIPCNRCRANEEEKKLMEEFDKQEELEMLYEEMSE